MSCPNCLDSAPVGDFAHNVAVRSKVPLQRNRSDSASIIGDIAHIRVLEPAYAKKKHVTRHFNCICATVSLLSQVREKYKYPCRTYKNNKVYSLAVSRHNSPTPVMFLIGLCFGTDPVHREAAPTYLYPRNRLLCTFLRTQQRARARLLLRNIPHRKHRCYRTGGKLKKSMHRTK